MIEMDEAMKYSLGETFRSNDACAIDWSRAHEERDTRMNARQKALLNFFGNRVWSDFHGLSEREKKAHGLETDPISFPEVWKTVHDSISSEDGGYWSVECREALESTVRRLLGPVHEETPEYRYMVEVAEKYRQVVKILARNVGAYQSALYGSKAPDPTKKFEPEFILDCQQTVKTFASRQDIQIEEKDFHAYFDGLCESLIKKNGLNSPQYAEYKEMQDNLKQQRKFLNEVVGDVFVEVSLELEGHPGETVALTAINPEAVKSLSFKKILSDHNDGSDANEKFLQTVGQLFGRDLKDLAENESDHEEFRAALREWRDGILESSKLSYYWKTRNLPPDEREMTQAREKMHSGEELAKAIIARVKSRGKAVMTDDEVLALERGVDEMRRLEANASGGTAKAIDQLIDSLDYTWKALAVIAATGGTGLIFEGFSATSGVGGVLGGVAHQALIGAAIPLVWTGAEEATVGAYRSYHGDPVDEIFVDAGAQVIRSTGHSLSIQSQLMFAGPWMIGQLGSRLGGAASGFMTLYYGKGAVETAIEGAKTAMNGSLSSKERVIGGIRGVFGAGMSIDLASNVGGEEVKVSKDDSAIHDYFKAQDAKARQDQNLKQWLDLIVKKHGKEGYKIEIAVNKNGIPQVASVKRLPPKPEGEKALESAQSKDAKPEEGQPAVASEVPPEIPKLKPEEVAQVEHDWEQMENELVEWNKPDPKTGKLEEFLLPEDLKDELNFEPGEKKIILTLAKKVQEKSTSKADYFRKLAQAFTSCSVKPKEKAGARNE
jgi:hypothetical protein